MRIFIMKINIENRRNYIREKDDEVDKKKTGNG